MGFTSLSPARRPPLRALFYFNITVNDDYLFGRDTLHRRKVGKHIRLKDNLFEKYVVRWDLERHKFSFTTEEAEQILRSACRHLDNAPLLQELLIEGYLGREFWDWVGDPHRLPNLVKMTLSGCIRCQHLPPIGQLPSLQELYISNMPELQLVGCELYIDGKLSDEDEDEDGSGVAFPELRVLTIINCPKLNSFQLAALPDTPCDPSSNSSALYPFPHLQLLHIQDCPELALLVGIHEISSMLPSAFWVVPRMSDFAPPQAGVDEMLAFSDGMKTNVNGSLNALREIMESAGRSITESINAMGEILEMLERELLRA